MKRPYWPLIKLIEWSVTIGGWLVLASLVLAIVQPARADIVTEFGMGWKVNSTTSVLMQEDCHAAQVFETRPPRPDLDGVVVSCGGDSPVFVGWPVAWERELGVWTVRAGWFHLSHWFDGKSRRELHMDAPTVSAKFNWTERKRRRRTR